MRSISRMLSAELAGDAKRRVPSPWKEREEHEIIY